MLAGESGLALAGVAQDVPDGAIYGGVDLPEIAQAGLGDLGIRRVAPNGAQGQIRDIYIT